MKDYFKFDTTPINPNPPIPKEIERAAVQYTSYFKNMICQCKMEV
jgi:hypothetical protein